MDDLGLERGAVLEADRAFLDSQARGETKAASVRAAIRSYLDEVAGSDDENNLVVAGALFALLQDAGNPQLTEIEIVHDGAGNLTNQIDIGLSFMLSPYRLTVARVL